jgi:hypothetical protein
MAYDLRNEPDEETFQAGLSKGFGRAILFLDRHRSERYREVILHTASHYMSYDGLCEDRADYLYRAITATSQAAYFRDCLIQTLRHLDSEDSNPEQVITLLRLLGIDGDETARRAVTDAFEQGVPVDRIDMLEDILLLDGSAGFAKAAQLIDLSTVPDEDSWRIVRPIEKWEEREGKEAVSEALTREAQSHPHLQIWLDSIRELQENRRKQVERWRQRPKPLSYEEILDLLDQLDSLPLDQARASLRSAGMRADSSTIERLADDLRQDKDVDRAGRMVHLFVRKPFPGDPSPIIRLLESSDEYAARSAMLALGGIRHPSLRPIALQYADKPGCEEIATSLLIHNLEAEDVPLLNDIINRSKDADKLHSLEIDIRGAADNHMELDCTEPIVKLYEMGACGICRNGLVNHLHKKQELPLWMADEILYDCYSSTRELGEAIQRS